MALQDFLHTCGIRLKSSPVILNILTCRIKAVWLWSNSYKKPPCSQSCNTISLTSAWKLLWTPSRSSGFVHVHHFKGVNDQTGGQTGWVLSEWLGVIWRIYFFLCCLYTKKHSSFWLIKGPCSQAVGLNLCELQFCQISFSFCIIPCAHSVAVIFFNDVLFLTDYLKMKMESRA